MLVKKVYLTFYKQFILGPTWFLIQPILSTKIYVILSGQIAKLLTNGGPQIAFYLAGITFWNYYSACLTKTWSFFKDNAAVMEEILPLP